MPRRPHHQDAGPRAPTLDTLTTRYEIGWRSRRAASTSTPEQAYRDLLADRQRVLGPDHPSTRIT